MQNSAQFCLHLYQYLDIKTQIHLDYPENRVFNNIQRYGNTTSATLPLCMWEAEKAGKLKKGDLVMTLAFGSGFTWGGNLIRW